MVHDFFLKHKLYFGSQSKIYQDSRHLLQNPKVPKNVMGFSNHAQRCTRPIFCMSTSPLQNIEKGNIPFVYICVGKKCVSCNTNIFSNKTLFFSSSSFKSSLFFRHVGEFREVFYRKLTMWYCKQFNFLLVIRSDRISRYRKFVHILVPKASLVSCW